MSNASEPTLDVLVGPTASGKSELALELAERAGAEIVSMDSMQVYRGMDVGTAKPPRAERERVRHHVVDLVGPRERYDVTRYLADAAAAGREIEGRGARALHVGGTGFYLAALLHGVFSAPPSDPERGPGRRAEIEARARALGSEALHAELARVDPEAAARIHPRDERRVVRGLEVWEGTGRPLSSWQSTWGFHGEPTSVRPHRIVVLGRAADELERRIAERVRAMLAGGWIEEVRGILAAGGFGPTSIQALGYREVTEHVEGRLGREELLESVRVRTRRFARRQGTWLRRFQGAGLEVTTVRAGEPGTADEVRRRLDL